MRLKIDIQSTGTGWQVQILDPSTARPILQNPRQLRRLGDSLQAVPLPPAEELAMIPTGTTFQERLCHALCTTSNVSDVIDIYARIINRAPENGDMEAFGRYLFATLFGKEVWQEIQNIAGHGEQELALTWQSGDQAINRLPWEMMHGPEKFLAEIPGVAVTRLVSGPADIPSTNIRSPRVLFVVGTEIGKDVIRPGAEYLGLIRTLQQAGLKLKTHLLLRASTNKLSAAIQWFQPNIVHFICHGGFDGTTSYLEFMSDQTPITTEPIPVRAANLLQALRPDPSMPLPSVVVLSACSMANVESIPQEAGQLASPLAIELVEGGIPIVVGMAGEVSDQACRLFSRRFFEALLQNRDIAHAVAEGRRGGIISHSGSDPRASVDWALPTLFLSERLEESPLQIDPPQHLQDWDAIAEEYAGTAYPSFCDRLELFQWCDLLMADTTTQRKTLSRQSDLQVLAIAVDSPSGTRHQYGRTRLLEEMAAHVVRDGHVPCLLTDKDVSGDWPKTLNNLLTAIMISANLLTGTRFGLNPPPMWKYIPLLLWHQKPGEDLPDWAADELKTVYSNVNQDLTHPIVMATAFRLDLLWFLDHICSTRPQQERDKAKLLLLIDDVHRMDTAASDLFHLLKYGLRVSPAQDKVRVVFTYSTVAGMGEGPAVDAIKKWLQEKWAESITLTGFTPPMEARLAYQQFLLNWREGNGSGPKKALTIAPGASEGLVNLLFRRIHRATRKGIPGYLASVEVLDEVQDVLDYAKQDFGVELLREAQDDDALKMV